jgi:hypothetical protein
VRTFTLQVPPHHAEPIVLAEGFSWGAFIFGPLWFLWHGLWVSALMLLAVELALSGLLTQAGVPVEVVGIPTIGLSLLVGFNARDWWRMTLARRNFTFAGVVMAQNLDEAEWKLMQRAFADVVPANGIPADRVPANGVPV